MVLAEEGPWVVVVATSACVAAELGHAGIVDKMSNLSEKTVLGYGHVEWVAVVTVGLEVAEEEGAGEVVDVVEAAAAGVAYVVVVGVYFEVLLPASAEQLTGIVEAAL